MNDYEFGSIRNPHFQICIEYPGTILGEEELDAGRFGLVLGDPDSLAYVIEGTVEELHEAGRRIANALSALPEGVELGE